MRGVADCHAPLLFAGVFGSGNAIGGPSFGSPGRERCFGQSVATESLHGVERCSRHLWLPRPFKKQIPPLRCGMTTGSSVAYVSGWLICLAGAWVWLEHGSGWSDTHPIRYPGRRRSPGCVCRRGQSNRTGKSNKPTNRSKGLQAQKGIHRCGWVLQSHSGAAAGALPPTIIHPGNSYPTEARGLWLSPLGNGDVTFW